MLTWRDYVFFSSLFFFFFFKCRARGPPSSRRQGRLASGSVAYLGRVYTPRTPPLQPENKPPFPPPTLPSPPTQPASRQTGEKPDSRWQHGLVSLGGRQPHTDFFSLRRFAWRKGPCIAQEQEQEQGSPTSSSFAFAAAASLPPSLVLQPSARTLSNPYHLSDVCPPQLHQAADGALMAASRGSKESSQGRAEKKITKKIHYERAKWELRAVQSEAGSGFTTWICQVTWLVEVCVSLGEDQSDSTSLIPAIKRLGEGTTGSGDTIINRRNCVQTLFYISRLLFAPELLTAKTCF